MNNKNKQKVELNNTSILVTGAAGFIGAAVVERLLRNVSDSTIVGLDNLNDYYDPKLKDYRVQKIEKAAEGSRSDLIFQKLDIADREKLQAVFDEYKPQIVINLAAQAGVRYSIDHPDEYIKSNIFGFYNILECCRHSYDDGNMGVKHLVYASSSSVYGGRTEVPFRVTDNVDAPVSLYAATKKSDELIAHAYSKLYNIPCTGLRFFTVYGPAGRPDMAYYSFTEKLRRGEKISIFNHGNMQRDFTYIDDIVEGIVRVIQGAPEKSVGSDGLPIPPYALYNIGGGQPENLMDFVKVLCEELKRVGVLEADFNINDHIEFLPMQAGDVPVTFADSSGLEDDYGFKPEVGIQTGLRNFATWYAEYIKDGDALDCNTADRGEVDDGADDHNTIRVGE